MIAAEGTAAYTAVPTVAASVAGAAYIVAALLFILALAGLSKHDTSRRGPMTPSRASTARSTRRGSRSCWLRHPA